MLAGLSSEMGLFLRGLSHTTQFTLWCQVSNQTGQPTSKPKNILFRHERDDDIFNFLGVCRILHFAKSTWKPNISEAATILKWMSKDTISAISETVDGTILEFPILKFILNLNFGAPECHNKRTIFSGWGPSDEHPFYILHTTFRSLSKNMDARSSVPSSYRDWSSIFFLKFT